MNIKNITFNPQLLNKTIKKVPLIVSVPIASTFLAASLKSDTVDLSKKAKFIRKLEKNHQCTDIKIKLNENSEEVILKKYIDSRYGSNPAFWALNPKNGKLYYIKYAQNKEQTGHIEAEIEASKLYNLAGIKTPNIQKCQLDSGEIALVSEYEPELVYIDNPKKIHKAYAADAWLANWDSLIDNNTMLSNNEPVKIDNGGALEYRAQGKLKDSFGDTVTELLTLIDGKNYISEYYYSSISHQDLLDSFESVCSISDKNIFETVKDSAKAQTLINRRNYMSRVLAKIKTTPYNSKDIVSYMKEVTSNLETQVFDAKIYAQELSEEYSKLVDKKTLTMPSTNTLYKLFLNFVKTKEKQGVIIDKDQLITLINEIANQELLQNNTNGFQAVTRNEYNKKVFIGLTRIANRTPQKEGEKISSYLDRIIKNYKRREKQLEDFRVENIKNRLEYSSDNKIRSIKKELSEEEKSEIIEYLNKEIEENYSELKPLTNDSSISKILSTWTLMCVGSHNILPKDIEKELFDFLEDYNSSDKPKTKIDYVFYDERFVKNNYKQDFKYEPIYRWMKFPKTNDFIDNFPCNGEIYTIDNNISCSMNKFYAEEKFCDSNPLMNVKLVIHPKSKISKAKVLGYNQEVIYKKDEKFKVLSKDLVEYTDTKSGTSNFKWEIHLQEI